MNWLCPQIRGHNHTAVCDYAAFTHGSDGRPTGVLSPGGGGGSGRTVSTCGFLPIYTSLPAKTYSQIQLRICVSK